MSHEQHSVVESLDKLYEFEQAPVSEDHLQPGRHFAGLLAGEHVAGTEFVIGAMFVAWGVSAFDIFVGLLIGNLMAVLTWTLICTPIAVSTRLTLYWYLRKIAGPGTTMLYNILNAVLFCILAGCMITVSASAVRIPFGIPAQVNWYPDSIGFVLVVFGVGAVVVALAIFGFKKLAQFASVCSPWLFLMFMGGAFALLPTLAVNTEGVDQLGGWQDFWVIANKLIWTGSAPEGQTAMTFWQVAAFAWICNLAMHGGLSDMALFRYAKSSAYGLYSAFGMFFGHYLAWIFAGIMGAGAAIVLKTALVDIDAGGVANAALGVSGIIAVVLAGWTTSNPTMYRAGLAFQAIVPTWPRWLVTLIAGVVTTIIACFPFVFTKLLDFVGWYGLLLMPVGAIVFVEHWIFPKIGFTRYWASYKKLTTSWPAVISWLVAIGFAFLLQQTGTLHLFYLFVPVWLLTAVVYTLLAAMAGARETYDNVEDAPPAPMPPAQNATTEKAEAAGNGNGPLLMGAKIVTLASLAACLFLSLWVLISDSAAYEARFELFKQALIWPSLIYFVSATIWVSLKDKAS